MGLSDVSGVGGHVDTTIGVVVMMVCGGWATRQG